jgi:hypothetical protein
MASAALGRDWQYHLYPTCHNQHTRQSAHFEARIHTLRERIETTFHVIQNTGRHLEHLLAKSVIGLCIRVAANMTCHALKVILLRDFGILVQTFQQL